MLLSNEQTRHAIQALNAIMREQETGHTLDPDDVQDVLDTNGVDWTADDNAE